ncbi:MAG: cysteine desulfurase [Oscillospiraceae bacterium]|jgi:cysteine desulfurase|nr:cysteine desulfurase [Oscillospiraceae bacterium]
MRVYFDNAATAPVRSEAARAFMRAMREAYGNPSSAHADGRRAADELASARVALAGAVGARPGEICFTSGGTESDNLALFGAARRRGPGRHIIISAVEHDAVRAPAERLASLGWSVTVLRPDAYGRIPAGELARELREDTALVSVMLVNNETGAINPVEEYADEIKRRGLPAVLHTDAVQALGKVPLSFQSLGADLMTVTAHKIGAPRGVGALIVRDGLKLRPALLGGGQEGGRRSGTEPLALIAAFAEAARLGAAELAQNAERARVLRDRLVLGIKQQLPGAVLIGAGDSPYILCLSLPGYRGEVLQSALDAQGISVSRGSACKRGSRSHVLDAMRLPPAVADGAIRVSLSPGNTSEQADYFIDKLSEIAAGLFTRGG